MQDLIAKAKSYLGRTGAPVMASEPVERGAVRRFAQAIMDDDPIYAGGEASRRYGGPVAPLLFPSSMIRRQFGTNDPLRDHAEDPNFDGLAGMGVPGLDPIEELSSLALLNGGAEIEFHQFANHGDEVTVTARYSDIVDKQTSKGLMILVTIESEYRNQRGELLLVTRNTIIRR